MPDHMILKLSRYLDISTSNMIPTHRNSLFSIDKKIRVFEPTVAHTCQFDQVKWCPLQLRRLLVHIILVFIDPDFSPTTHPTNVAWDSLHHGLVYGRLALSSRPTLYDQQDSNMDCPEATMWEEWSLFCLFVAFRWFTGWHTVLPSNARFLMTGTRCCASRISR